MAGAIAKIQRKSLDAIPARVLNVSNKGDEPMTETRRHLLALTGIKPMFRTVLINRDGGEQVSTARFADAAAARKFYTTGRMAAKWGYAVKSVEAM